MASRRGPDRPARLLAFGAALVAALAAGPSAPGGLPGAGAASGNPSSGAPAPLPVRFEPNRGQADPEARFLARCDGYTGFLTESGVVFVPGGRAGPPLPERRVRMGFAGAGPARYEASRPLPGLSHYLKGNDPARWTREVPGFGRVDARGVWPGVDLAFRGGEGRLEYALRLAPGADPASVAFRFEGTREIGVDGNGDLVLEVADGTMRHSRPVCWQEDGGSRAEVEGRFAVRGTDLVGLEFGRRDPSLPLFVDPRVDYASYHGGSGSDLVQGIRVDAGGNIFVAGSTTSTDFPLKGPYQASHAGGPAPFPGDAFVTKVSPAGSLVYSTYLGGSGFDDATGLALGSGGSVLLCGTTSSTGFPVASAYQAAYGGGASDAFVAGLSSAGSSLVFSTYLGGSGAEEARGIGHHPATGEVVVAGWTTGSFPLRNPLQGTGGGGGRDGFVTRFASPPTTLRWSTYLGGSGVDAPVAVAVDPAGSVHVGGTTDSTDFPTAGPIQSSYAGGTGPAPGDAFVAKIDAAGTALAYSTYYGGSGFDDATSVTVDADGSAVLVGSTSSSDFPTTVAIQGAFRGGDSDGFVVKLSPAGDSVVYATYFGGSGTDVLLGAAQDGSGKVTVGGFTSSADFPLRNPYQTSYRGGGSPSPNDAVVARLAANGSLLFSTYLGGNGFDDGRSVAIDAAGWAYLAGITSSTDFPTEGPGQASLKGGAYDGYVTRLALVTPAAPTDLVAAFLPYGAIRLQWVPHSTDEAGFEVARKTATTGWVLLPPIPAGRDSYEDFFLTPYTTYTYRVRAMADGTSDWSNEATAASGALPSIPARPTNLVLSPLSPSAVLVTWNDNSHDETVFEVARGAPGTPFATVASLPPGTTAWTDTGVLPAREYSWRVRAVGVTGVSGYTPDASATTPPTMEIALRKGALRRAGRVGRDSVRLAGTFTLLDASPEGVLDPASGGFTLLLRTTGVPVSLTAPADHSGWRVRGPKVRWNSPKSSPWKVRFSFHLDRGTFRCTARRLNLPDPPAQPLRFVLGSGADGGAHEAGWRTKREGVLRYP